MKYKTYLIGPSSELFAFQNEFFTQVRIVSIDYNGKEYPVLQTFGPMAKIIAQTIIDKLGLEIEK